VNNSEIEAALSARAVELSSHATLDEAERVSRSIREDALSQVHGIFLKIKNGEPVNGELEKLTQSLRLLSKHPQSTFENLFGVPILESGRLLELKDIPIDYVLEPLAIRGCLTQLHGPSKGGKSTVSLHLAVCLAWGHFPGESPLISIQEAQRVLFISWEDAAALLARRICNYSAGLGMGFTIPENLHVVESPDLALNVEEHALVLEAKIMENKYDLVILDTFSFAHDANEDKAFEIKPIMRTLKKMARKTKSAIWYIHHRVKAQDGRSMSEKARGSSAISAAADIIIDWGDRGGSDVTPMEFNSKWGRSGQWEIEYSRQEDGSVKWDFRELIRKCKKSDIKMDAVLATVSALKSTYENKVPGPQIVAVMTQEGMSKPTVYRYLSMLVDSGKLSAIVEGTTKFYAF